MTITWSSHDIYRIAENFRKFHSFVAICESFSAKFCGLAVFRRGKSKQSMEVFSVKIVFFTNSRKFSPSKFPAIHHIPSHDHHMIITTITWSSHDHHNHHMTITWPSHDIYHIAENFRGRNFCEFHSFVAICESFSAKFWGLAVFRRGKSKQSVKVFSVKIVFFTNSRRFSPSKFSAIHHMTITWLSHDQHNHHMINTWPSHDHHRWGMECQICHPIVTWQKNLSYDFA